MYRTMSRQQRDASRRREKQNALAASEGGDTAAGSDDESDLSSLASSIVTFTNRQHNQEKEAVRREGANPNPNHSLSGRSSSGPHKTLGLAGRNKAQSNSNSIKSPPKMAPGPAAPQPTAAPNPEPGSSKLMSRMQSTKFVVQESSPSPNLCTNPTPNPTPTPSHRDPGRVLPLHQQPVHLEPLRLETCSPR